MFSFLNFRMMKRNKILSFSILFLFAALVSEFESGHWSSKTFSFSELVASRNQFLVFSEAAYGAVSSEGDGVLKSEDDNDEGCTSTGCLGGIRSFLRKKKKAVKNKWRAAKAYVGGKFSKLRGFFRRNRDGENQPLLGSDSDSASGRGKVFPIEGERLSRTTSVSLPHTTTASLPRRRASLPKRFSPAALGMRMPPPLKMSGSERRLSLPSRSSHHLDRRTSLPNISLSPFGTKLPPTVSTTEEEFGPERGTSYDDEQYSSTETPTENELSSATPELAPGGDGSASYNDMLHSYNSLDNGDDGFFGPRRSSV